MTISASRAATGTALLQTGSGLLWTEGWYLLATVVAAVVIVDPLEWELAAMPALKHLALALALPAFMLTTIGSRLREPWRGTGRVPVGPAAAMWPLLFLAAVILAGGAHARFAQGIQNTFINFGLYMLAAYCAAAMVVRSRDPEALVRGHVQILLAAAVVMSAYLVADFGVRQVYHEQIFLVIPMALLFFSLRGWVLLRWIATAFFLFTALLSAKYTSYLIAGLMVFYLAFVIAIPRLAPSRGIRRATLAYWFWLAGGLAVIVLAFLGLNGMLDLPTGNVSYRYYTYLLAWERFLDSPLWGTLFAVEAVEKFERYSIVAGNMLATHSDVLDILANGGIIALALWLYALVRVARVAGKYLLRPERFERSLAPYAHALAGMSIAAVVTYAFNPILLQPSLAYLVWTNLGMLLGLALRVAAGESVSPVYREATDAASRRNAGAFTRPPHRLGA